jgi:hypothetical protein
MSEMKQRILRQFASVVAEEGEEASLLKELKAGHPTRMTRRMTCLGILLNHVLRDFAIDEQVAIVYVSAFSETGALEQYLDSLPFASPVGFQTSIHPSGAEQGLITRKQAIGPFFPIAGEGNLLLLGLQAAMALGEDRVILCGGEERGNWTLEHGLSAPHTFAFAMELVAGDGAPPTADSSDRCLAEVAWDPEGAQATDAEATLPLIEAVEALRRREPLRMGKRDFGQFSIVWR